MPNSRKIVITSCNHCPHHDHHGGFGKIAYVPVCRLAKRDLPYSEAASGGNVTACPTGIIPDWCPLARNEN